MSDVATCELAMGLGSAAQARVFVGSVLAGWGLDRLCQDAALVVTELVVNATIHARSATTVTLRRRPSSVRIEVRDASRSLPVRRDPDDQAVSGRGLRILDVLAPGWEVMAERDGKVVVAELSAPCSDVEASGPPGSAPTR